jgi:pimeloyl-ACP methyl ester carboxylesterase
MTDRVIVVFVHGLWMTGVDMALLRRRVRQCGFAVKQFSYPNIRADVKANAGRLQQFLSRIDADTIHLVGHSLGGLVIRQFLHDCSGQDLCHKVGRIVTLGTPHQGSLVARAMATYTLFKYFLGQSFHNGLDGHVPPWQGSHELGVIAGSLNIGVGRLVSSFSGVSDGTVLLDETRLEGMTDHVTVPVSHTVLLFSSQATRQVCAFLHHGHFEHVRYLV